MTNDRQQSHRVPEHTLLRAAGNQLSGSLQMGGGYKGHEEPLRGEDFYLFIYFAHHLRPWRWLSR